MAKILLTLTSILLLSGCNIKRIDTTQAMEEMKKSEIKRITSEQISSFANEWGTEITKYLNQNKAHAENIDSLNHLFKTNITKVNISVVNFDSIDTKEAELMKAYQYNLTNILPINENLQKLNGGEIQLYTAPVAGEKNTIWRVPFSKKEIIKKVSVADIKKLVVK